MIHTFAILLLFQTVGETIAFGFSLPVPGPVIGMLLLFCFLIARPSLAGKLAPATLEFLKHLSLLFIPAGVGIMVHAQRVATEWLPILAALVISATVSLIVTALVLRGLQK